MTGLEALQSVQFVTVKGKRLAVVSADAWKTMIDWLETVEDLQIVRDAYDQLRKAKGNRKRAGCQKWTDVRDEL